MAGKFHKAGDVIPYFFCKYCGKKAQSLLKTEDTCFGCFKIDEAGKTKPKFDSKTGNKLQRHANQRAGR